ncbi:MAG: hypothetical protein KAS75_05470 [Planctomycetes bacterium]|nr:hypothetical protein [Planctomycetota bacterium]
MPHPLYHAGPSIFLGLAFRKWIDLPVFLLANVVVDIELFLFKGWPSHGYFHTLLVGGAVGAVWGLAAYPFRGFFGKVMRLIGLPYETGFWKMVLSGILGLWLHVFIDSIYHWDVRLFWPNMRDRLYRHHWLTKGEVKIAGIVFLIAAIILYISDVKAHMKEGRGNRGE